LTPDQAFAERRAARVTFVGLAAATIALGLWVHRGGATLGPVARDVLGDALWATMIAWWIGAAAPRAKLRVRGAVALAICVAVELSQLIQAPWLDAIRRTTLGNLVLGSGFDTRDLLAYLAGVMAAVILERTLRAALVRATR
jgi:hypothetical protein